MMTSRLPSITDARTRGSEQIDGLVIGATYNNVNELISQQPAGAIVVAGTVNEPEAVTVAGQTAVITPGNQFRGASPVVTGTTTFAVTATPPREMRRRSSTK